MDTRTDEETIFLEKRSPLLVKKNTVCLQIVFNALAGFCMLLLKRYDLTKKIKTAERGFASLPGKDNLRARDAFDILPDEKLQRFFIHPAGAGPVR